MGELGFTQWLSIASLIIGGGGGLYVLISSLVNKFGKGPAERQTEVEFGVGILQQQLQRAAEESKRWLEIEQFLREELRKSESDKDRVEDLLRKANAQILSLQRERNELINRQTLLVAKFTRGEQITLADIIGQPGIQKDLDQLEETLAS
ncbi:membrane protein [Microbacterium phage Huwbert]|nr:membrane protein [Microbacterium phage Huwbert]